MCPNAKDLALNLLQGGALCTLLPPEEEGRGLEKKPKEKIQGPKSAEKRVALNMDTKWTFPSGISYTEKQSVKIRLIIAVNCSARRNIKIHLADRSNSVGNLKIALCSHPSSGKHAKPEMTNSSSDQIAAKQGVSSTDTK